MFYARDGSSGDVRQFLIEIQDIDWLIEAVVGALEALSVEVNWIELGTVTSEVAAARGLDVLDSFSEVE